MQKAFDELYQQSKNGNNFYKLLEIIGSEQNICLAYRNLKTNSGSKTAGTDGKTIEDIKGLSDREVIETVRKQLADYHPQSVRRVFIPKPGSDKKRPLGIPCIWDRLIQQCILQVLEPICEPKFHNHSYGFRQNRDAHHAVSRVVSMVNMYKHYYCVDVDIKGFFDNVNHGKLLKQIHYIMNPEKTESGLWTGSNCGNNEKEIYQTMIDTKSQFEKEWGRQGYHIVISFPPDEDVDEKTVYEFGKQFCQEYLKDNYEYCFAVHNDHEHLHCHIIFNIY